MDDAVEDTSEQSSVPDDLVDNELMRTHDRQRRRHTLTVVEAIPTQEVKGG